MCTAIHLLFLRTSLHVAQPVLFSVFCQTPVSARLLTYLDDSSTSASSQITTFAHPISQQIHMTMKNLLLEWRGMPPFKKEEIDQVTLHVDFCEAIRRQSC